MVLVGIMEGGEGKLHEFDFDNNLDRILAGVELVMTGKNDVILFGGGPLNSR
ncbi:MAG: hypothetical protein M2R45_02661 [Verrucomicrobia subdivision 3 bacterium]|nr:hypothetical protein [Limisphaerales bacterium]MCS1414038.1 hypothetical protein [Limisphaerales bacterium]